MTLLFSIPGGMEFLIIFVIVCFLIPAILYIRTLENTLRSVSPENRKMPAGNVWLLLIPLFGLIWHFIVVTKMADSIKAEAVSRDIIITEQRPAFNIGMAMCICNCFFSVAYIKNIAVVAGLICWIAYWVKISEYKKLLSNARLI